MTKNLVIVESPAKAKTISRFLGKDYVIRASMGHIRDLPPKRLGVDIEKNYHPEYVTSYDKRKIVKELKQQAEQAEVIWLATDEDREGEAISWHLVKTLGIDEHKVNRIVFHEITKSAIMAAIDTPRKIDYNLVNAQQARRILDRLVGFELSPLLWQKIMPKLSAGRVQSVATRLIVDKENEIKEFNEQEYYKINAEFIVNDVSLKAEKPETLSCMDTAREFLEDCLNAQFAVKKIDKKPGKKTPPPPYTTSTLQQDASRRLGFTVSKTMLIAQQLYESGLITYMRTDSVTLSKLAFQTIKKEIISKYGEKYYKFRQYTTKSKGAQEAHEAIRPTYINNEEIAGTKEQQKLYKLVRERTLACQMSDALLEKTTVTISISTRKDYLIAKAEVIKFPGFLKINGNNKSAEEVPFIPHLEIGEKLILKEMTALQKFTLPPVRYNEAMLVRKLEELGIGRPSTYAPIISTIQKRKYVEKLNKPALSRKVVILRLAMGKITAKEKSEKYGQQKGKLFPTDIGIIVNDFLMQYFSEIMDYNFTASVVEEFDKIANGELEWQEMLEKFYKPFHKQVESTGLESKKHSGKRILGIDPKSGRKVIARLGKFGPMIQIGEPDEKEKPLFASIPKSISLDNIDLQAALKLFEFPRNLGKYKNENVLLATGRYGPYLKWAKNNFSLGKKVDLEDIDLQKAIEIINEQLKFKQSRIIKEFENGKLKVLNGKYGPYISQGKKNYKIPKGHDPVDLTLEECQKIISETDKKKKKRSK